MATAFTWTSVSAQFTLIGKVLDAETRDPLPGATVQIQNSTLATVADESGAFVFRNIADAKVTMVARFVGFSELIQEVDLQKSTTIELFLVASNMLSENVIVTATRATKNRP